MVYPIADKNRLSTLDHDRHLQNIVVHDSSEDITASPTMAPTTDLKTVRTVVCKEVSVGTFALKTEINISYAAETDAAFADLPMDFLNREIPAFVAEAAISTTADSLCDDDRIRHGRLLRQLSEYSHCVISVSSGKPGKLQGTCNPTLPQSESCHWYEDSFSVLHTSECTEDEIRSVSSAAVTNGLESASFLQSVNSEIDDATVTRLALYSPDDGSLSNARAPPTTVLVDQSGLTPVGGFLVFVILFSMLALVVFLFAWRRRINRKRQLEDDLKSVRTDWSANSLGDGSYLQPNFRDLGLHHSKLNVHRCKSAMCTVCRPSLGTVHILKVAPGVTRVGYDGRVDSERENDQQCQTLSPLELDSFEELPPPEHGLDISMDEGSEAEVSINNAKAGRFSFLPGRSLQRKPANPMHQTSNINPALELEPTMDTEPAVENREEAKEDHQSGRFQFLSRRSTRDSQAHPEADSYDNDLALSIQEGSVGSDGSDSYQFVRVANARRADSGSRSSGSSKEVIL